MHNFKVCRIFFPCSFREKKNDAIVSYKLSGVWQSLGEMSGYAEVISQRSRSPASQFRSSMCVRTLDPSVVAYIFWYTVQRWT